MGPSKRRGVFYLFYFIFFDTGVSEIFPVPAERFSVRKQLICWLYLAAHDSLGTWIK